MRIQKSESLNESAQRFVESNIIPPKDWEEKGETTFIISCDDANDDIQVLKQLKSSGTIRKNLNKFLDPEEKKMKKLGATALYVDDSNGNSMFTAYKNDDGTWDIVEDRIEEVVELNLDDEYKDILVNRIVYSLTGSPENTKFKSPKLAKNLVEVPTKNKLGDQDNFGYKFEDGNAIITITLGKSQINLSYKYPEENEKRLKEKSEAIKKVCDHYGVDCKQSGRSFTITVPDQEKYFTDTYEKAK